LPSERLIAAEIRTSAYPSGRYHYYFRFAGDKIAPGREYCDSDYVRKSCCRDGRAIHLRHAPKLFEARIVGKHFVAVIL